MARQPYRPAFGSSLRRVWLCVAIDGRTLIDRRLKRDAALQTLLRDDDVERRVWAPAG